MDLGVSLRFFPRGRFFLQNNLNGALSLYMHYIHFMYCMYIFFGLGKKGRGQGLVLRDSIRDYFTASSSI